MTSAIDMTPQQRDQLLTILRRFIPGVAVWAYGSRVKGTARRNSDLDLVTFTTPAQGPLVSELRETIAESNIPFLVDLHVWDEIPERFREIIRKEHVVLQEAEEKGGEGGEWLTMTLRDANVTLIDCDHRTPQSVDSGYPYVAIPQIRDGRIDLANVRRITREHYLEWTRKAKPSADDVILSRRCNPGESAVAPPDLEFALGQNLVLLRADGMKVYPPFLRWLVRGPEWWEQIGKFVNVGAVFDSLKCADIPNFEFRIPPLHEQRAIAHILGTLDDKIEMNRRMNETLEAMARALFKSWFVDFDPVRAKAAGRDPGLPKDLADLFPDRFVDSELGEIPEGWEVGSLADFASLNPEIWSKETRPGKINYVDLSNTKWGRIEAISTYGWHDAPSRAQRVLRPRDTIVGTVRPGNGSYAFISEDGLTGSTGFAVLRPLKIEYAEFVYFTATAAENIEALSHLADGGAYPAVRPEIVTATQVINSCDDEIEWFSRIAEPLVAKMAGNARQSRTLTALRDTLLPKLISGELQVKQAEELIKETV